MVGYPIRNHGRWTPKGAASFELILKKTDKMKSEQITFASLTGSERLKTSKIIPELECMVIKMGSVKRI